VQQLNTSSIKVSAESISFAIGQTMPKLIVERDKVSASRNLAEDFLLEKNLPLNSKPFHTT
jgi:hypothetical protein